MPRLSLLALLGLAMLAACSSATPTGGSETLSVQYTFAASPWLGALSTCAGGNVLRQEQRAADYLDLGSANLALRLGQPTDLTTPAYQIATEDILVILNRQNPLDRLTSAQVRGLFSGQVRNWKDLGGASAPVTVWVFSSDEDIQQLFDQAALGGAPVSSEAMLAATPDQMAQAVAADENAVGLLPRHWKAGNISDAYTVATVPVLALVPSAPPGAL
ncbi:MAG TPA: substrate-binding domain-containing protein, partial [Anaerolineales bacterium]|nr:substrate-binding domain-containing protein [Anaerolineales bacterium]